MSANIDKKRFICIAEQNLTIGCSVSVVVDSKTGDNYLAAQILFGGSVMRLLDKEGNPIISQLPLNNEGKRKPDKKRFVRIAEQGMGGGIGMLVFEDTNTGVKYTAAHV